MQEGQPLTDDGLARQLWLHLHRGIRYLAAPKIITTITDLIRLAAEQGDPAMEHPLPLGVLPVAAPADAPDAGRDSGR